MSGYQLSGAAVQYAQYINGTYQLGAVGSVQGSSPVVAGIASLNAAPIVTTSTMLSSFICAGPGVYQVCIQPFLATNTNAPTAAALYVAHSNSTAANGAQAPAVSGDNWTYTVAGSTLIISGDVIEMSYPLVTTFVVTTPGSYINISLGLQTAGGAGTWSVPALANGCRCIKLA